MPNHRLVRMAARTVLYLKICFHITAAAVERLAVVPQSKL